MATTIVNATLTTVITETVTINGKNQGSTNTLTVANINEVDSRILTIPTSEVGVVTFGAAAGAGTFVRANVQYLRITNKDDTNFISLHITSATDDAWFKLDAGKSFIVNNGNIESAGAFSAWALITAITAIADTAAVDVDYFIALT
jgi:hypothetical protein